MDTDRLKRFFEISLSMLCTASEDGLRFDDLNPVWEETLGWTLDELRSKPFVDFIHPDDLQPTFDIVSQMKEGSPAINFENRYQHKNGSWVWLSWASVLRDGRFYAAARDVTQSKQTEAALREANAELSQFAYAASHDLQEPLRAITGHLEFMDLTGLSEGGLRSLDFVQTAARSMQGLIDGLLAYSRVDNQGAQFRTVQTARVVQKAIDALDDAIRRSGGQVEVQGTLPVLTGDPIQLTEVFQNVLANALKYKKPDTRPRVVVSADRDGDGWRFTVTDNGVGLDPSRGARAFEMFQRLHRRSQYEGRGVGLALVKRIVQRHGGRVSLTGEPGVGATLQLWLPEGASSPI